MASITNVVLSRVSLQFLNELCKELGFSNEPVIFQTEADVKAKKNSVLGKGQHAAERLHCGRFLVICISFLKIDHSCIAIAPLHAVKNVRNMDKFLDENAAPPEGAQSILTRVAHTPQAAPHRVRDAPHQP